MSRALVTQLHFGVDVDGRTVDELEDNNGRRRQGFSLTATRFGGIQKRNCKVRDLGSEILQSQLDSQSGHYAFFADDYFGRFLIEENRIVINVDIAWDESWNGKEQVQCYKLLR